MFRLRQNVRRDEFRVLLIVRDDEDLGRPCKHIDAHVAVHFLFGKGNENVAGARDNVYLRNALRTVGERGDRLRTADFEYLFRAAQIRRNKHGGRDFSVFGGRTYENMLHSRRLGRQNAHHHRTEQGRRAAGNVDARALHRADGVARGAAVFGADILPQGVAAVIGEHVRRRLFHGGEQIVIQRGVCRADLLPAHGDGIFIQNGTVEFFAVCKERRVAAPAHRRDDLPHRRDLLRVVETPPL